MKDIIETDRLILKNLNEFNVNKVLDFLEKGRHIFENYEMEKVPIYYTDLYQRNVLSQEYTATKNNRYVRYYVFLKEQPDVIIGTISCGSITPDPYECGTIGYKFDEDYWHRGYARESLRAVIEEIFAEIKLHRLIAYVMDDNIPSCKLLEAVGFEVEGVCKKNLKVNGVWKNHILYALLNPYEEN